MCNQTVNIETKQLKFKQELNQIGIIIIKAVDNDRGNFHRIQRLSTKAKTLSRADVKNHSKIIACEVQVRSGQIGSPTRSV